MAVVAPALLLGALVGVVWARPQNRPRSADSLRKVTLAGSDFISHHDAANWWNDGGYVMCQGASCSFTAPVVFPCLPSVDVVRVRLHVTDSNATWTAIARIYRAYPPTGADVWLGEAESPPGTSGGVRTYTSANINQTVWPSQRAYIWLVINGPSIYVHGVTVEYRRNI
jgi:hypothetical protein